MADLCMWAEQNIWAGYNVWAEIRCLEKYIWAELCELKKLYGLKT